MTTGAPNPQWKKKIAETLRSCGIVDDKYTGRVVFYMNQGGIRQAAKEVETEVIR